MKWAPGGTCAALVAILVCSACGSFGADNGGADAGPGASVTGDAGDAGDAAPACFAETCGDAGPSCSFHDFHAGCGRDFSFTGDTTMAGVVGVCSEGKAHVAADNTLDITAELGASTPGAYVAIHVSARIAVTEWDGGRALTVELDRMTVAEIDVVMAASGRPQFRLCNAGNCAGQPFEANVGEEHLFAFDITSSSVSLSVDCMPLGTRPAQITLAPSANLLVKFGRTDASPIDGTIDDIGVSFR